MKIHLDKIASATKNVGLSSDAILSSEIPAEEGIVIAVRVHGTKTVYNNVEDLHGRMIRLDDGDLLAGVLGSRRALRGYAGVVPETVKPGDMLDILNLGGVIGKCTSTNIDLGAPLQAEVLGAILDFPYLEERRGVPASIRTDAIPWSETLEPSAPLVFVAGTCMHSGKTFACGEIIHGLAKKGYKVCGTKLTGVSLLRDTLSMEDRGAIKSLSFNDSGIVSTSEKVSVPVAKGIINALNKEEPDLIVVELGDGILGEYGVQAILHDKELMTAAGLHLLCAPDPVASWGGAELYKNKFKLKLSVISGPATDNDVGKNFIRESVGIAAINSRLEAKALADFIEAAVLKETPAELSCA
ncbi:MAG: hypothetical protein COB53_10035 [Elusimicrobia bacterium]|nr:MAG: hypothetical protein COB53_10035 [Elusimicrobiota bacterium]